jgi:glutaminyl-tRNA synthetase
MSDAESTAPTNFIRQIIDRDRVAGVHDGQVVTRFPPEPNGYLHIGHAKAICLNFGVAADYDGHCFMRFDDTNPEKEQPEFVAAIQRDVRWLGYDWGNHLTHASDYFERFYLCAERLVEMGEAYVCSLSADEMREHRGTLTEPGTASPYRDRTAPESLDLLHRMRAGEFADGAHVLRARIDMASPNLSLRDPVLYRIRRQTHHQTGDEWCIYPMYDFAHCLSDAFENVTHSLCTLEFVDNRALYDWVLDTLGFEERPHQYEFSRLNLDYAVTSKRRLTQLVDSGVVSGWDDPRMPTISGLRRLGYPAAAIRDFCERIGVTRNENAIEMGALENCVREALDAVAPRAMAVLDPLKVVVTTYADDAADEFDAANNPRDPEMGTRKVTFSREIYIERADFEEVPPRKFFRLAPGQEVRLRYAWLVRCTDVIKDAEGNVIEVHVTHDPDSRGGNSPDGRKVKGTIHWVSARHGSNVRVNVYDRLFNASVPGEATGDFLDDINPESLTVLEAAWVEPSLLEAPPGETYQFERTGYFCVDTNNSKPGTPVFNKTLGLRDSWAKAQGK